MGATSSGKGFKYEVIEADATKLTAKVSALEAANVVMNANLGFAGFISSTHLYLTPKVGDQVEVEITGAEINGRQVNFFPNIDKTKQKAFIDALRIKDEIGELVSIERALDEANSGMDIEKLMKVRLLREQTKLVSRKIAQLGDDEM